MIIFGKVENKKLIYNKIKMSEYINSLSDCEIELEIRKKRKKRSINQNSLYWAWLGIISDDTGYYPEELHHSFSAMFLTDKSQKIPLVRSTTRLNTDQFTIYLDKIDNIARDLGISLPTPDEYYSNLNI